MDRNAAKELALKNAIQNEIVTDEFDPLRGYWVRSEEGDIIRANGERGYWSSEPPRLEFRAERRRKLK
ncbi:MAG: hypothetical protein OIN66_15110 [Candidatus Methanoperedens sp.]|nr:hypothetical protein [Candidatus Methanoperedens sp.]